MSISEVGAYAPSAGQSVLALDKPAQALFMDGTQAQMQPDSLPSYADDGDANTTSQASGQYRWIQQIDLQKPQSLDLITLLQPDSAYATAFHIDVSIDGSKFWTVARTTDSGAGLTGIQLDSPVTARYIRIVADHPDGGGQTGGQMAISELAAYSLR